jgi:hypothetical protein
MHRLAENCRAANSGHLVHGVECRGHVIASHVEAPRSGWIHVRQFFNSSGSPHTINFDR